MLTRIMLRNVRRHTSTELTFSADEQLILLDGPNGSGKTTILEAVQWALFGYTRHGRAGLAQMVRRGAENEGMEVQLDFTSSGVSYQVTRRWVNGKSTALLSADGQPMHRSPSAVNAEIASILGVDAAGFAMSAIATQTDRVELTSLSTAARRQAVTRLFRFDAFTSARSEARSRYVSASERAKGVAEAAEEFDADRHDQLVAQAAAAAAAAREAADAVAELDAQVSAAAGVAADFSAAAAAAAAAAARRDAAVQAVDAAAQRLDAEVAARPEMPSERPGDAAAAARAEAEAVKGVASAASAATVAAGLEGRRRAVAALAGRLERARKVVVDAGGAQAADAAAQTAVEQARQAAARREQTSRDEVAASAALDAARGRCTAAQARLVEVSQLGARCSLCGQPVDDEHRQVEQSAARKEVEEAAVAEKAAAEAAVQAADSAAQAAVEAGQAAVKAGQAEKAATLAASAEAEVAEVAPALEAARDQLAQAEAIVDAAPTVEQADAALACARGEVAAVQRWDEAMRAVDAWSARVKAAQDAVEQAAQAAQVAGEAEVTARVPAGLEQAAASYQELVARRAGEADFAGSLAVAAERAGAQVEASEASRRRAAEAAAAASGYRVAARTASKAAELLSRAAVLAAADARPRLQARVEDLLTVMSAGRFSQVRIDDDYRVQVRDLDGVLMDMSEYSGGEQDLVALAVRLALAQTVAASSKVGFIILDEVFGSQDADRCATIIDALRSLRDIYGQIFIISHVGGLNEGADRVVSVSWDRDEQTSSAA